MEKPFTPERFTPTKWESAEQKAKFANHMVRFIDKGYPITLFHKWFYIRLSMCFNHIAHFNRHGFYCEWFKDRESQKEFHRNMMDWKCYGDPEYTYSDVERALIKYYS